MRTSNRRIRIQEFGLTCISVHQRAIDLHIDVHARQLHVEFSLPAIGAARKR